MSASSEQADAIERDRLVESHLPLVRAIARRYAGRGETLDDLVQVGAIGLVRASKRFDPDRGVAFGTFVTPAIEGEIRRHLGDHAAALRIPRELQRRTGELRRWREHLTASLGRSPSADELAAALGVQRGDVELALEAEHAREQIPESSDTLESSRQYEFPSATDDRLSLADGLRVLDERERRIVFLRFFADLTERDIARELTISQGTVSRLLTGALGKLRDELSDQDPAIGGGDISDDVPIPAAEPRERVQDPAQTRGEPRRGKSARSRIAAVGGTRQTAGSRQTAGARRTAGSRQTAETRQAARAGAKAGLRQGPMEQASESQPKASGSSGRFLVRMPSALHQELSHAAEREQVSLNRYVTETLAQSLSTDPSDNAPAQDDRAPANVAPGRRRTFRMLVAANLVVIVIAAAAAITLLVLALERGI